MTQATQNYKRTLAGSVGSGMGSVFGGGGKRFYILEHKTSSKYHSAGDTQRIIVDQVEIGRDPKCQVRYDESFSTVSRRHAAIVRDGDNWKLMQLSTTNPTFLNGRIVEGEWYLQNGDEIQLSTNGPKLGFILPQGEKGLVKSIGMTARLNLFRQQALRPYKAALTILSIVLVLAIGGLVAWKIIGDQEWNKKLELTKQNFEKEQAQFDEQLVELASKNSSLEASLDTEREKSEELQKNLEARISHLNNRISSQPKIVVGETLSTGKSQAADNKSVADTEKEETTKEEAKKEEASKEEPAKKEPVVLSGAQLIEPALSHVYYIRASRVEITMPGSDKIMVLQNSWSGTGFLLEDGRFVTARNVIEPWYYVIRNESIDKDMLLLNEVVNKGGKISVQFEAFSSTGSHLIFTHDRFECDRTRDRKIKNKSKDEVIVANHDATDWGYVKTERREGLKYDPLKSTNLETRTELYILGFPLGLGATSTNRINPIYGSSFVAMPGLSEIGTILTTNSNYEVGSSGGPVFYQDPSTNQLTVVGIVSGMAGRSMGYIVPISVIR